MFVEALRFIVVLGVVLGANRFANANPRSFGSFDPQNTVLIFTLLGAAGGYILGGVIARTVDRLLKGAEERVARHHASEIVAATLGILVGALASAIVVWPILAFVHPEYVAFAMAAFLGLIVLSFTARLAVRKRLELFGVLGVAPITDAGRGGGCLLDSSAAIDGRVLALYKAGLLPQPLCVPAFIIWEMQGIADSGDPLRRRRGQRGLDMLASLREAGTEVRVLDEDPAGTSDPDAKLVVIARRRGLPIVTSDSNLAKAAELQGVGVLNLHRLTELLRPPVLPGERAKVRIGREGRERGQGVGYLDDGTMVVVEGASASLGDELEVEVTSVLQNDRGRTLFAKLVGPDGPPLQEVR
jgi:uncharacterized protein YacL